MKLVPTLFLSEAADKRRRWVALAVAAQVLFILLVAGAGSAISSYGRAVVLRTSPVDPRDLLYGDYVTLNYDISQLPRPLWRGSEAPRRHRPVYVELRPTPAGYYEAVAVYPAEPASLPADHVALRGWIVNVWRQGLQLRYGLERYYVPEGEGRKLERRAGRQPLLVHVSVAPWDQSRITRVETTPKQAERP
ncbi:hypothetical protein D3Y59_12170 [Hymenobacter oligotrophus]|uniref:GDYXXLXY domain-containing protein n=1 Tax=Hymenobacter oligotrophus TaxID=2319843 RepID=A0A3B7REQ4_9BACT|nr:GDYXXLXY domain-containing protein [Hymenobacter oligotrophus]AYA37736.1 hypothetical protein D3Y59_12170 [Hymenobacter oligotrophus]